MIECLVLIVLACASIWFLNGYDDAKRHGAVRTGSLDAWPEVEDGN